uniref:DUF4283 domain-containing protein n=1 Tax=Brassica campestris TaxID=3711 RepID=M4EUW1_BRACM
MDSLKSDSNPLAKVPATVDVATVDPSVDMVLPTSGTPPLATISGGSFSASPKESDQPISTVTTSNAWSKPLSITQPSSAATVLMQTSKELIADLSRETQWPSLSAANCAPSRRRQPVARAINASRPSPHNSYSSSVTAKVPLGICDNDPEYPWASKMEKSKRNLHKVTSPEFLEDGTPKVRIPRHVLLEGLENQKEFVIGQFYRCSAPASGLIQSVVSRIWGTRCRIYTREIGNNAFLFHIPDEFTRKWVVQRGIWHVDDCIMFVSTWDPKGTITVPEISTIPVWLTLKDIPHQLYSKKGISWIASGIGAPMLTSKPWLDPILMGEAKILVEVKLDRPFPQRVALEDESGSVSMVSVIYSWLPSVCPKCGQLGHKAPRCLGLPPVPINAVSENSSAAYQSLKATKSAPLESQEKPDTLSFDSQGCILLDHEGSGLPINENSEIEEPSREVTTVPSASVVAVNTPTGSFTEKVHVSCTPSETVQVTHVTAVTDEKELPPPTVVSVSPNDETCKQLDVSVSPNDETCKQLDVAEPVDSSTQSVPPTPEAPSGKFVGNVDIVVDNSNSSPSSVPFVHDNLFAVLDSADASEPSSVPPAKELVFSNSPLPFTFASHDTSPIHPRDPFVDDESTLRSRGGRPLKPSQRLKEMEWFTVTGKGKRGRGRGPHH